MVLKVVNTLTGGVLMRADSVEVAEREAKRQAERLAPAVIAITVGQELQDDDGEPVISTYQARAGKASQ